MVESGEWRAPIEAAALAVRMEEGMHAATLRYFEPRGAFAAAVREATGAALPQPLEATQSADGHLTLAWRSPTETLLHTPSTERSEEHTSELQSQSNLVCRLLLEKKMTKPSLTSAGFRHFVL